MFKYNMSLILAIYKLKLLKALSSILDLDLSFNTIKMATLTQNSYSYGFADV